MLQTLHYISKQVKKSSVLIMIIGNGEEEEGVLEIMTLHDGMILSTLSISSHGFALDFPKGLIPTEIVFFTYKSMIFY